MRRFVSSPMFAVLLLSSLTTQAVMARSTFGSVGGPFMANRRGWLQPRESLSIFRGGASRSRGSKKSRTGSLSSKKTATGKTKVGAHKEDKQEPGILSHYKKILPLTRAYITLVAVVTLAGLVLGEETTQSLFALDPIRTVYGMQIWRAITAASFLGPPSLGWVFDMYHLFTYGSTLERAHGTAQHFVLLFTMFCMLSVCSMVIGQPFYTTSMIASMVYVLSRAAPGQKVGWLVIRIPFWLLPYGMMTTDVLQSQSPMAAFPHILGILCGHFYQFHKFIWPKVQGDDWLVPPDFVRNMLDPDAIKKVKTPTRKRTQGRKLGSK